MFKTIVTLFRGAAARAEQDFIDRSALLILDQQIRDAAAAIERAKRALALAIAQDEAEGKRLEATLKRLADLEERALAALAEAEATLKRLRGRQAEDAAAAAAFNALDTGNPAAIADGLEAAGFGKRSHTTAADVLARLKQKTAPAPAN